MGTTAVRTVGPVLEPPARWVRWFGWGAFLFFVASQATGVLISPPERDMGHLQKILYVHVPAAWTSFIAFGVVFVAGIVYLWRRSERADLMAASAAEIGTVLTALTLALGSIWGKPTWGVWWTWDPRLTLTAVTFVIFVGYLALRAFVDDPERRARWSAVVGILGALNVPIVYMSVKWWRTIHQMQSSPSTVDPEYALGLRLNAFAFLFIFLYLLARRYRAAKAERATEVRQDARALGGGV